MFYKKQNISALLLSQYIIKDCIKLLKIIKFIFYLTNLARIYHY